MLADDLAEVAVADMDLVCAGPLADDLPDLHFLRPIDEALRDQLDKRLQSLLAGLWDCLRGLALPFIRRLRWPTGLVAVGGASTSGSFTVPPEFG